MGIILVLYVKVENYFDVVTESMNHVVSGFSKYFSCEILKYCFKTLRIEAYTVLLVSMTEFIIELLFYTAQINCI